ncbi:hypothetical protein G15_1554 [Enterococcus avium]|nr:hypothetical protein G15_1554 [Enterococcus avium]
MKLSKRKQRIDKHKHKITYETALSKEQKNKSSKVVEDSSKDNEERIE